MSCTSIHSNGRMGITSQKAKHRHPLKYTLRNALYTAQYLLGVQALHWSCIHFVDETRMDSRLLREMAWAEVGRGVEIQRQDAQIESWSVTLLTDLRNQHGFVLSQPIQGTNSAVDHLESIVNWLEHGVLLAGDVLILDNASIHNSVEVLGLISLLLDAAGVRMYFLPTYSPEFNPCELVFARAKRYLRHERGTKQFLAEILEAFGCVTYESILAYYEQCIRKPLIG